MNLERYGIQADFPRLTKLTDEVSGLEARHREQQQTVAALRGELQGAVEDDLNREAAAVKSGRKTPKPRAPELAAKLNAAEHDAEVISRAVRMSRDELGRYISEHRDELRESILDALHSRAIALREHALACLELFAGLEDSRTDLRQLRPQPEPEEFMEPGTWTGNKVSSSFINFGPGLAPQTGLDRGTIEGVLAHLAGLTRQFEDRQREGAA